MAKSKKMKSKKELDRRHNKKDLITKSEVIEPEEVSSGSSDVTWNSIEEFTEAATATGLIYDGDFIPVNVPALYDAYTSNPTEFKQSAVYKFLTK